MIEFGISSTIANDKDIYSTIDLVGKSSFKWIEIRCDLPHFKYEDTGEIKKVKKRLKKERIKAIALHPPGWVDLSTGEEWVRMKSVREVEKTILVADRLKTPRVIVHPGSKSGLLKQTRISLNEIKEFANEWKVEPILENTIPPYFGSEPEVLKSLSNEFDLKICLDTSHAAAKGGRVEEFLIMLGERIKHFHISDSYMEGGDDHLLPLQGKIDWLPLEEFLNEFDGYIIFELLPQKNLNETLKILYKISNEWKKNKT
ncbi:MAG: sugar phosphate isomerase/epimerase [Candidatus Stahlbacteria bacterium]|nr:MAG: sugar phosphate isomerase/epimerase [Candidatus Stahlbacteria bacterium]